MWLGIVIGLAVVTAGLIFLALATKGWQNFYLYVQKRRGILSTHKPSLYSSSEDDETSNLISKDRTKAMGKPGYIPVRTSVQEEDSISVPLETEIQ
jgi:hypothetical protein